ncbi:polysaccharide pyruvyl transferase family protein [bacterium]|nr:polysaccharide pyruvyl transferase family protein [bacterium]MBU1990834.1 polysaccharide pyruvyl transferase family protein [bacterium]
MFFYIKKIKHFLEFLIFGLYYRVMRPFCNKNTYKLSWDAKFNNFGDIITPYILENISDAKFQRIDKSQYYPYEHYFVIGSILDRATKHTIVWGSGLISEDSVPIESPQKVYAVRGPKTRKKLLELGIECPEIYGDPALLLPRIYHPKIEKKYKLGIIPHYADKSTPWLHHLDLGDEIKIIDIQAEDPLDFIRELLACQRIASSSLHGIITADAYRIPSLWLEFSDKVKGEGFKFYDYFLSVGRKDTTPFMVTQTTTIPQIMESFSEYSIEIDLDRLLEVCPFGCKKNDTH